MSLKSPGPLSCLCTKLSYVDRAVLSIMKGKDFDKVYTFRDYNLPLRPDPQDNIIDWPNPGFTSQESIWQVCRAATASPSYFKKAKIDGRVYLDGGL